MVAVLLGIAWVARGEEPAAAPPGPPGVPCVVAGTQLRLTPEQARHVETISVPPPDSVPMIEAPPPMSLSAPTTTPALIRPSTIEGPRVPAL